MYRMISNTLRHRKSRFFIWLLLAPIFLFSQEDFDTRRILMPPILGWQYDDFGSYVVKKGETILVASPQYNDGKGAVDYYQFRDGRAVHQQTIIYEGIERYERFGYTLALDGPVAVIGTEREQIYIYRFDGFQWNQEQTIFIPNEYYFGRSIDISGDRIIVGVPAYDSPGKGAIIYKYDGTQWIEETTLVPASYVPGEWVPDGFGINVQIDGNIAVVSAPDESSGGDCRGTFHTYEFDGITWQHTDSVWICQFDMWAYGWYGFPMILEGDLLCIGNMDYNQHGAVEVMRRNGRHWDYEERVIPEETNQYAMFGQNITIDNNMIAVSEGGEVSSKKVRLYKYERNHWQEKYAFEEPDVSYYYAASISLDQLVLLAGTPHSGLIPDQSCGAVAIYELIEQPANISVSNGTATNRVKINWKSSSEMTESYKIYRDGEEIATTLPGARSHNDYDAIPGMIYDYDVIAYCTKWGETVPKGGYGWRLPAGRIDGSVQTRYGAGVRNVELLVRPVSEYMTSVLEFDDETDYAMMKDFSTFPDTALTVSFWLKSSDMGHAGSLVSFCSVDNDNEMLVYNHRNFQIFLGASTSVQTGVSAADGAWHHIAMTWRSTDGAVNLYKDGVVAWQGTLAEGDTLAPTGYLVLGQDQDKPGGGFQTIQAYLGLLDDIRIWRTARTEAQINSDMSGVLTGTEKHLVAYWTFDDADRGPEGIIPDLASGGGHHLGIFGTEMLADDTAPVANRTYSDPYGDYSIKNLYYEESREFSISPSKPRHGFDPGERQRTLDQNNPTMTAVNFTDTTSFSIAGRVVQRFGDAVCYLPGAEIWVDNIFMGVKTDANGEFNVSVEEAGQHKMQAKFHEHHIQPAEMMLDVNDDVFDLEFIDTEMDTVSGYIRASCQTYIGRADLRIYNQANPFAAIDTTIRTNAGSGYYQVILPSRIYYTEVVALTPSDPLLIPRPEDVIEYFDVTPVDLTDSSMVQNFTYRKPPVIEISGWPEYGCAPFDVPILEMDVAYPLMIEVYEEFGGDRCLVDTGTVTIYDDIGLENQEPVVLELQGGTAFYNLTAGEPNILSGGQHPYQKILQVEADITGEKSTSETWVLVTGHRPREQTFATISPDLPFLILRDPPGDASYSYVEKEAELRQTMSLNMKTSMGLNTWMATKLGCKMNLGWMAETVVDVWGTFRNGMEMKIETTNQYEYGLVFKSSQKFTTSDRSFISGEGGDVFLGAALNLIYALTDVIAYDADSCKVDKYVTVVVGSEGFATNFIYTENHIRNVLIPQLAQLRDIYERTGSDSAKIYINQIDIWNQTLVLNQELKKKAVKIENRSFSSGARYEHTSEITVSSQSRLEFNLEINRTIAMEAGAEIAGSGISGGMEIRMGMGMGFAQAINITQTNKTGYVLDDDDAGDFFSVDIKQDLAYGTPVFSLVAGRSSCPWEKGSQPRDGVSLMIDSRVQNYVPAGEPATFILSLGNTSQSDETREYHLRMVHGSNPDGAIVKLSGVVMGGALSYFIPAGEQFTASLTVERGPLANDYENLQVMMYPPCEYEYWEQGMNLTIADTVTFSVHYESPESQISLIMPENNWVINQTNNDSLQILIGDYNLNNPFMESIKFQYRRIGEGWTTYFWVPRKDIDPEYTTFFWDVSMLPDGNYELRAVNDCGNRGVNYSSIASGIIDRRALIVMGTPEPSDGILNLGESISVSFSSDIDCGKIDPEENVSLRKEDGTPIEFELGCYQNQLMIIPKESISLYENQLLTATVNEIRGESGNVLREPVSWSFRISINPVYWTVSNVSKTIYQQKASQFERTLKNAGNQDETFSIDKFPAWVQPQPLDGTIPPGGEQVIVFTVDSLLNVGSYQDTVFVQTSQGDEFLLVDLDVLKTPPVWHVNPSQYAHSMNITGRVILPDGLSEDVFDMISAYVNNECRGAAQVSHSPTTDEYLAYLTVYSNQIQGEPLQLRVWDASKGKEFVFLSGSFTFNSDATLGNTSNPVIIEPKACVHSIEMAGGWTWFSMNVIPARMDLTSLTQGLTPADGDVIKGQYGYSQYQEDAGWTGPLWLLESGQSYRMYASQHQSMRCVGTPVNLSKQPLAVHEGWTWIGFPSQEIMDINDALQDFPAYPGDRMKSQTEYAEYVAGTGTWEGSLQNLVPGRGYMIRSQEGGQINLPVLQKTFTYAAQPGWQLNVTSYEYTMSLTGAVMFNKAAMNDTAAVIGAFDGNVCKGLGKLNYIPELDRYIVFLMIYGENADGDTLQFKVFDPVVGQVRDVEESIIFTSDAILGKVSDPMLLTAQGIGDELVPYTYYLNQNYPNPFNPETVIAYGLPDGGNVKLEVYTVLGQKVATVVNERQDAGRYTLRFSAREHLLANGIYFYQLKVNDFIASRKFLVLK